MQIGRGQQKLLSAPRTIEAHKAIVEIESVTEFRLHPANSVFQARLLLRDHRLGDRGLDVAQLSGQGRAGTLENGVPRLRSAFR